MKRLALLVLVLTLLSGIRFRAGDASAVISQMYTFPFEGQFVKTCGFGCYSGHLGTDYQLGDTSAGGHPVNAAARGTAWRFDDFVSGAGYYIVIDHENGHRTRYLHLASRVAASGQIVARGQPIGYEGNSGGPWCQNPPQCTIYASPYHLHFEVRHNGTSGNNCCSGTAVDPYGGSTYSWNTNPPGTARDLDFSGDGYPDVLARETGSAGVLCMVKGNGVGGWIADPGGACGDGTAIGSEWDNFDYILRPGDWNHDGFDDVIGRIPGSDGLLCLVAGNGQGGWIPNPDPPCWDGTLIGSDWDVYDWIIGPRDFSGDGFPDLLARENWGSRDLCLIKGNGYGSWIADPGGECGDGTKVGWGWGIYNWLLAPSDWTGNGDSCPDVVARQSASPYWVKYHSGNCNSGFIEQTGVNIESAWSAYDWLLSVGDFSGGVSNVGCPDVLQRWGGGYYLNMRRGNCNGGFTGSGSTIGYGWNVFNWLF